MTITSDTAFRKGPDVFGAVVWAMSAVAWDAPSPCHCFTRRLTR
jgi:hypothetical protein